MSGSPAGENPAQVLIAAAVALADTLARENTALAALDLPRAGELLADKECHTGAFAAAHARLAAAGDALPPALRTMAETVGSRLATLGAENRRLLERALFVQERVIGSLARAVPQALEVAPRYDAGGSLRTAPRPPPVMLAARA